MKQFSRTLVIAVFVLCCWTHSVLAATRTWAGGTHNWNTTAAWVEAVVPTSADSCVFNVNTTGTLTIESAGATDVCGSVDFTGFTGTLTHTGGVQLNIAGNLKLVSGMTYSTSFTSIFNFINTSGTAQLTTAGKHVSSITMNGVGGTLQFQDGVDPIANATITLTNGTIDTNSQTVGATSGVDLSSSNSNTRALTLGTTTWSTAGAAVAAWNLATTTGLTFSGASSTIKWGTTGGGALTFAGGGLTYGTLQSYSTGLGVHTISGTDTFSNLTLTSANSSLSFALAANQHVTGTLTATGGNSTQQRDYITSDTKGTARTITVDTTVTASNVEFQDITGAGAASWDLHSVSGGSGNCGGNSGITFTTPGNAYMKTAASANWTSANWFTTSGGSTPFPNGIPLCQDTAIFDANSVTAGSVTITLDVQALRVSGMNWTGVLHTPVLSFNSSGSNLSFFGNVVLVSGMSLSGTSPVVFEGRGAQTITSAGLTWTPPITINSAAGTWIQADNFTSSGTGTGGSGDFVMTSGQWLTGANTFTMSGSAAKFNVPSGTFTAQGTASLTGTGGANITVSGTGLLDATGQTVSMTGASSTLTLSGGTFNVGVLTRTGFACTLAGTALTVGTSTDCTTWAINSGTLASVNGKKMSFNAGAISTVNDGSCTFGQADTWPSPEAANDNINRYTPAQQRRANARNG